MPADINMRKTTELLSEVEAFNSQWIELYIDVEKRGMKPATKKKIREKLGKMGRVHLNKRFDQVTKDDLEDWVDAPRANELNDPDYPEYEDQTKTTYLKVAKPFFTWMHKQDDPTFASWIKPGNFRTKITADDIWTEEEMNAMRSVLKTPRDKAMFEVLYESAMRPFEFLSLSRSDLESDENSIPYIFRKGKQDFLEISY